MPATVKYIGDEESTEAFGHSFKADETLKKHTLTKRELSTLFYNPHFEVAGFEPDEEDQKEQAEAAKPVEQRGEDEAKAKAHLDPDTNDKRG